MQILLELTNKNELGVLRKEARMHSSSAEKHNKPGTPEGQEKLLHCPAGPLQNPSANISGLWGRIMDGAI